MLLYFLTGSIIMHLLIVLIPLTIILFAVTVHAKRHAEEPSGTERLLTRSTPLSGTVIKSALSDDRTMRTTVIAANGTYYVLNSNAGLMMPAKGQTAELLILPEPLPVTQGILTDRTRTCVLAQHAKPYLAGCADRSRYRSSFRGFRTAFLIALMLTLIVFFLFAAGFLRLYL